MGEVRWPVTYPEREENWQQKKNAVLNELVKSKLLVPVKYNGDLKCRAEQFKCRTGTGPDPSADHQ